MRLRCNVLNSHFHHLDTDARIKLFNTHCICLYGGCLWDLTNPNIKLDEIAWRKSCHSILKLPQNTHCRFIEYLIRTPNVKQILQQRKINFIIKGINHDNELVRNIFVNSLINYSSGIVKNINVILNTFEIPYSRIFVANKTNSCGKKSL